MADLFICKEAEAEIEALYDIDEDAAALIDLLIYTLANDKEMLDVLCRPHHHFDYEPPFEIKKFAEMQQRGKNVFALRVRDQQGHLLDWRVLIAYHAQRDTYHVLAAPRRDIAYDIHDPTFATVVHRYEQLGIPDY